MSKTIRLPMWADIELEVSLYEFYQILKDKTYQNDFVDHYNKWRMEQVEKLFEYIYKKKIE